MGNPKEMTVAELHAELDRCERAIGETTRAASRLEARMKALTEELQRRQHSVSEPRVSDHALLRYLERVHGADVEKARRAVMTDAVRDAILAGASGVTVDGVKFIVKNLTIVTAVNVVKPTKAVRPKAVLDDEPAEQV